MVAFVRSKTKLSSSGKFNLHTEDFRENWKYSLDSKKNLLIKVWYWNIENIFPDVIMLGVYLQIGNISEKKIPKYISFLLPVSTLEPSNSQTIVFP